jgi:hypothetical protein
MNIPEKADQRTAPVGELMQIVFAQDYRARAAQPEHDLRVFVRNSIGEKLARSGRANSCRID